MYNMVSTQLTAPLEYKSNMAAHLELLINPLFGYDLLCDAHLFEKKKLAAFVDFSLCLLVPITVNLH